MIAAADKALTHVPYSVTAKSSTPESGDQHDYMSIGPYWWPDPTKRDGKPYVRRDGKVNPEREGNAFDRERLGDFSRDVSLLALAYHATGDQRYAVHAAALIRAWFLDPATRMNPNLDFAQAVPGRSAGRKEGVIDANELVPVVESIGLLGPAKVFDAQDQAGLETWFGKFVTWLATSPIGRAERASKNNHGTYYDMMIGQFALFARLDPVTEHVVQDFPVRRIAVQVAVDGRLPLELERTRSWHYAHWNLAAMSQVAMLGECVGRDLWHARLADGRGIGPVLAWLAPYQESAASWANDDLDLADWHKRPRALQEGRQAVRITAWGLRDPRVAAAAHASQSPALSIDALNIPLFQEPPT